MTRTNSQFKDLISTMLDGVVDPLSGKGLISSGRLQGLTIKEDGAVGFVIEVASAPTPIDEALCARAEAAVKTVEGVSRVTAVLTAHTAAPTQPGASRHRKGDNTAARDAAPSAPPKGQAQPPRQGIPGVQTMIAVASAKGGVGKSTVTVNLAAACARLGLKVGILDADVYGPSIPTMLGTTQESPRQEGGKLYPIEAHGLKTMSIGYLADQDAPMVWRGPVVASALNQMMNDVEWGELDILFVDTPPGTGDIQLTLAQRAPLDGAVIVSTPQEVALADVRRGVAMFRKTHTAVLGIIENMAWFEDPASGNRSYIFGEGGARRTAEALDVPFLSEIPLAPALREGGDTGQPAVLSGAPAGDIFLQLAENLLACMETSTNKPPPAIIFE